MKVELTILRSNTKDSPNATGLKCKIFFNFQVLSASASEVLESWRYIYETSQMHNAYNSKRQSTEIGQAFFVVIPAACRVGLKSDHRSWWNYLDDHSTTPLTEQPAVESLEDSDYIILYIDARVCEWAFILSIYVFAIVCTYLILFVFMSLWRLSCVHGALQTTFDGHFYSL